MPALVTFGRVLFAVLFMYTGATKLFALQQTADFIATKVTIPALLAPYTSQLETMTGMPMPQLLAIAEYITKTHAICMKCGQPANYSQRTFESEERVAVGAVGMYEARCRRCFVPHADAPTSINGG